MQVTEFQELVKDAPKFVSMERGELVTCAYAMYAAGAKTDAENAKLRELCVDIYEMAYHEFPSAFEAAFADRMRELGVEVTT